MEFNLIDMATYNRKEHFDHYMSRVPCSYSMVVNINITKLFHSLKKRLLKHYPAQIYILASAVNRLPEFRMSLDRQGRLGYWEAVNPLYTVLHKEKETFSALWTSYTDVFEQFYSAYELDCQLFSNGSLYPKPHYPENTLSISSTPWLDFTAFNINTFSNEPYLLPIFTIGKYTMTGESIMMPLAIQVNHAVCDGLHISKLIENINLLINQCDLWLP